MLQIFFQEHLKTELFFMQKKKYLNKHSKESTPDRCLFKASLLHAMQAWSGSRGIALLICNYSTRWGWLLNAMPWLIYPQEKAPISTVQEAGWAPEPVWMGLD